MRLTADSGALFGTREAVPAGAELEAMADVADRHVPLNGHCLSCGCAVGESGWCWIREVAERRLSGAVPARHELSTLMGPYSPTEPPGRDPRDIWRRG
ncbi:hypothetical protein I0C86_42635 [Plantactinospora sp. S1510]|uniref:Uncharacterized protein n=1 Tax=Plantactinospora alkalitolerans TaxID=2789879 RepID=A0ABS0HB64_9ACTN|nr:hypothetical protein [Plantactinospora alkalitolerans]MBF9135541.1 hypothetical protein [Plantactinospora alkalitolerans]